MADNSKGRVDWNQLSHAYGAAGDIPEKIRALQSSDPAVWVRAMGGLYDTLCHQMCSIYPATAAAIPLLIELIAKSNVSCRGRIVQLLADIAFVAGQESEVETASEGEVNQNVNSELLQGIDVFTDLLVDSLPQVRIQVPYLLGSIAWDVKSQKVIIADIMHQMKTQFLAEQHLLVRASFVFGLACFASYATDLDNWFLERVSDTAESSAVRMAAALSYAERTTILPTLVEEFLFANLANPEATDHLFQPEQPPMETRHHPIGRAMLQFLGKFKASDDRGKQEDMQFPWTTRWKSGWVSFRIIDLLVDREVADREYCLRSMLPYLDRATVHTSDSLVLPIVKSVFKGKTLTKNTRPEELSDLESLVLRRIFDNVGLWATNVDQRFFGVIGLGDRRSDWARVLGANAGFSPQQIVEILEQQIHNQRSTSPARVTEIRLCRVGSADFLPYLRAYPNLETLDFAETDFTDSDLESLAELRQLRNLRLNNTQITDAGVALLSDMNNLEQLYLAGTLVSDRCLDSLAKLPKLRYVYLPRTQVTSVAATRFMESRPECSLSF
ncbi:MAG: hypothetical protein U1A77_11960 [Pirellulales bacterium]